MWKRLERVTAKTGRTSCTNWTISFGVPGLRTRTHLLHGHFILLNLFELQTFFCVPMHHSKRCQQFSKLSNIICYFLSFTDLFRELNDREIENHYKMNSENVETWHGNIISPTWLVKKSREGYGKNWTHFVYKLGNLFRSIRVSDENSSVTRALHFLKLIWTPDLFGVPTQHSKRRHQFSTPSNIICYFSVIYRFV